MVEQNSLVEYGARRVIITITAIFCALLEIVDTTIVNVALNEMKGNLGATLNEVRESAKAFGMKTLRADGVEKVKAGITTLEEVYKATT